MFFLYSFSSIFLDAADKNIKVPFYNNDKKNSAMCCRDHNINRAELLSKKSFTHLMKHDFLAMTYIILATLTAMGKYVYSLRC